MELIKKIAQHSGSLYAVAYSKKLNLIFTGGADKIIASWDPENFENNPFSIKTNSAILNLNIIDENHLFVGLFNGNFHIIDLETKKELKYITKHTKGVFSSCVTKNNQLIVGSGDGHVSIWDTKDYTLLFEKQICEGKIRAISSIDNQVFIGDSNGNLFTLDLNTFDFSAQGYSIDEEGISSICYLEEKNCLLIGGKNAWMFVFDLSTRKTIHSFPAHNWPIYQIIYNREIGLFSCSRDKIIKKWNVDTLETQERYSWPNHKGHTHSINNMCFVPSYKYLVSIGDDKSICIWA